MLPGSQAYLARHEYPMKAWKKMLGLLLGVFLTLGSYYVGASTAFSPDRSISVVTALFFLAGGIYMLAWAYRSRLILDGSHVEIRTAFREQIADVGEIEGFRTFQSRNGTFKRLILKNGAGTIRLQNDFDIDEDYRIWFRQIPDLDQRDGDAVLDAIKKQEDLGTTPDERLATLATAKTIGIFSLIVSIAVALVLIFADPIARIPAGVALAFAPLFVLYAVWKSPLLYAIFKPKADPRAELGFILMVTSFAFLFILTGVHLVSIRPLAPIMVALACLFMAPVLVSSREGSFVMRGAIALLFFSGIYGYSLTVAIDTQLDQAATTSFRTTVTGKYETHGRSTSYNFYLAPWGPFQDTSRVGVSASVYGKTSEGDEVCLTLHPGALHGAWFQIVNCSSVPPSSSWQ